MAYFPPYTYNLEPKPFKFLLPCLTPNHKTAYINSFGADYPLATYRTPPLQSHDQEVYPRYRELSVLTRSILQHEGH
jgi:hypothetical protein